MINIPKKPDYGFAYFIVFLLYFISVVIFFVGLSLAGPALNGNSTIFQYTYGVYGVGLMIVSIATLAAAQISKAVLDTALFSWHTMHFHSLTNQNNLNFSDQAQGNSEKM